MRRKAKGLVIDESALFRMLDGAKVALRRPAAVSALTLARMPCPQKARELCDILGISIHDFTVSDVDTTRRGPRHFTAQLSHPPREARSLATRLAWDLLTDDASSAERARRDDVPVVMLADLVQDVGASTGNPSSSTRTRHGPR